MDYEHKVRKNVSRARREGVTVETDPGGIHLERFLEIYRATLDRRHADEFFYFGEAWFRTWLEALAGQFIFFHAWAGGSIVSTELVVVSQNHLYSFLGGTDPKASEFRPNDLLKHEIIRWGRQAGKTHFVLGGGVLRATEAGADGVLRYKRAFAPHGLVPFQVMRWIIDEAIYEAVVAGRARAEMAAGRCWVPRENFFPAYRG